MADRLVRLEKEGDVAILTMDDPATRNSLSWGMADALRAALTKLGDARALIITGAGNCFCSGGNLTMDGADQEGFGDILDKGIRESINPLMITLAELNIPVIAVVNGAAVGAGASLALSADFVVVGENAFFLFAFPKVGLALDAGASWILPRLVGLPRATEALMLAERIDPRRALDWGMIYSVVPESELVQEGLKLANRLANGPTLAFGEIRLATRFAQVHGYAEALARESDAQKLCGNTADCREAINAFRGKRAARFCGN